MRDRGERQGDDSSPVVSIWIAYGEQGLMGRRKTKGRESVSSFQVLPPHLSR